MEFTCVILLCLLGAVAGGNNDEIRTIWCTNSYIRRQPDLLKGIKQEDMICEADETKIYPFTDDKDDTPPSPESIDLQVATYRTRERNNSLQIAIFVTWRYKVQYLDSVKNFHIDQYVMKSNFRRTELFDLSAARQYILKWNKTKTSSSKNTSRLIQFGYIYCGKPGNYHIQPWDEFTFKIQACPIYHEDKEPQVATKDITIPGCKNQQISHTQICIDRNNKRKKQKRIRGNTKDKGKKKDGVNDRTPTSTSAPSLQEELRPLTMILLSFGASVVIVILAFTAWCCRKRIYSCLGKKVKSNGAQQGMKNVVLVCNSDKMFLKPINQFINLFTRFDQIEIVCNLRQSNEIGELGIPEWMKRNIGNADMIAFIIVNSHDIESSEQDSSSGDSSQVSVALKASERMIFYDRSEFGHKNFIVIDFANCTKKGDFPYFMCYKFPRDFEKFVKLLIGDVRLLDLSQKKIFFHALEIAKLGGYHSQNHAQELDACVEVENFNNLNDPTQISLESYPEIEGEDQLNNILDSHPPSFECNQSDCCITTDFNDNQSERHHQAGARSKTCR